jgi:hypothetical protein
VRRLIWVGLGEHAFEVAPLWPWRIAARYGGDLWDFQHRARPAPGQWVAQIAARSLASERRRSMLEFHLMEFAAWVWFTRHANASELTQFVADRRLFARLPFDAVPEELSVAQLAFVVARDWGGRVTPESRARILQRWFAAGLIDRWEVDAALAEPLPGSEVGCFAPDVDDPDAP